MSVRLWLTFSIRDMILAVGLVGCLLGWLRERQYNNLVKERFGTFIAAYDDAVTKGTTCSISEVDGRYGESHQIVVEWSVYTEDRGEPSTIENAVSHDELITNEYPTTSYPSTPIIFPIKSIAEAEGKGVSSSPAVEDSIDSSRHKPSGQPDEQLRYSAVQSLETVCD